MRIIFLTIFLIFNLVAINQIYASEPTINLSEQEQKSELTINLSEQKEPGTLLLALYSNEKTFKESVKRAKRSEIGVVAGMELFLEPQESSLLTIKIPDGEYAMVLFIDSNGNEKLDKFFGIPQEQYGFSNNAWGKYTPPTFEQAKFNVSGKTVQNIQLK